MEISGAWMNQVWAEKPVKVLTDIEAANEFLSQTELPYMWPDIEGYVSKVNKSRNPQRELRIEWTAAYLTHPNPLIIANTLQNNVTTDLLNSWLIGGLLPELLVHSDVKIQEDAAKALWRNAMNLKSIFGVLTGEYPGITKTAKVYHESGTFKLMAGSIVKNLRKYCPPEKKEKFEELVLESFGPSLSEKKDAKSSGEVKFKESTTKNRMVSQ